MALVFMSTGCTSSRGNLPIRVFEHCFSALSSTLLLGFTTKPPLQTKSVFGVRAKDPPNRKTRYVVVRSYHERVVDHYNNPRNVGSFDKSDPNVGTALVGAPACGDVVKLQIRVDEKTGEIIDACFKTFGCGSAIAASSVVTEWIKGKKLVEVLTIKNSEIAKHLSLPPVKLHCSMLAEDAIKAAVKDYEAKRVEAGTSVNA
ncbi:iron-sulfur cluster assembly protein 1-like [Papaver somniferum]|uniref:iron-sulfur cluster assembly protein 1-like n=1 Tax=Papaver somniferum TaxID=3469 RepID=UPI000E700A17|nr:iron-sulfur cluster assembly protein 1-like [Papaver somniferum]